MSERWLPIDGQDGYYEVSDSGKVRSVRYDSRGNVIYSKELKPAKNTRGYSHVVLSKQNVRSNYVVHRLVAIAFLPNPDNLPEVNHIDGDKSNNAVSNLEWCSGSDNLCHAYANGLKYKVGKPVVCVETGEVFDSVKDAMKLFGFTSYHISRVCNHEPECITAGGYHWEWVN